MELWNSGDTKSLSTPVEGGGFHFEATTIFQLDLDFR